MPERLLDGHYELIEVKAPDKYFLDPDAMAFTVNKDFNGVVSLTKADTPLKGKIELSKLGDMFTSVKTSDSDFGTVNAPSFSKTYMDGATFEVRAAEDIVLNGETKYTKGQLVDTITTNANGPVDSIDLYIGKYTITETKTKAGFKLDTTPHEVSVTNDGTVKVSTVNVSLENERAKTAINAEKTANVWKDTSSGSTVSRVIVKTAGAGFTFGLYANQDYTTVDGKSTIAKDSLVAYGVTDKDGNLSFTQEIPFGSYYVKELKAPETHYTLSTDKYVVNASTEKTDGATIVVDATNGTLLNDFPHFPVTITKTDITDSKPVAGAQVTIKDETGKVVYSELTGEDGTLPNISLEPGKYTFEETVAPAGYVRNTAVFSFTVNADGKVEGTTSFTDKPTDVILTKTDLTSGKPVPGAEITIYDKNGSTVFTGITDKSGKIEKTHLNVGTPYTFKETLAPDSYAINTSTFKLVINNDGSVSGDTNIVDSKIVKNPKTGSQQSDPFASAAMMMAAGALAVVAIFRRKKLAD